MSEKSNRQPALVTMVTQALHFIEVKTGAVVPSIQPAATYARDENYEIRNRIGIGVMEARQRHMLRR